MEEKNPIQVADRLFLVLETLASDGPIALADLSRQLALNKSTVHRLLCSLIYMGYVKQDTDTQKYDLSLKLLSLSNRLLSRMDILEVVRPHLKKLSEKTGETVHFVQLDGAEAVYIYKEESYQNSVRMVSKVGNRIPLYCSGVGKAMAADMDEEQIRRFWIVCIAISQDGRFRNINRIHSPMIMDLLRIICQNSCVSCVKITTVI